MPKCSSFTITIHITLDANRKDDAVEYTYLATWRDMSERAKSPEEAVNALMAKLRQRFVALAEVYDHLDEGGQKTLAELASIFAPEKIDEAERAG